MTYRELMQQALEALEDMLGWESLAPQSVQASSKQSLQRLREALAHPDPEPVAWMVYTIDGKSAFVTDNPKDFTQDHRALPLYTSPSTPPPQHQADPVVWQFRMRPDWVRDKDFWEPWTNCTKEQAANYQRVPHLHDWTYESRSLFTHPIQRKPLTDEQKLDLVTNWFAEDWAIKKALGLLHDYDIKQAQGIGGKE